MKTRLLTLFLTLCLTVSLLPAPALATNPAAPAGDTNTTWTQEATDPMADDAYIAPEPVPGDQVRSVFLLLGWIPLLFGLLLTRTTGWTPRATRKLLAFLLPVIFLIGIYETLMDGLIALDGSTVFLLLLPTCFAAGLVLGTLLRWARDKGRGR